MSNTVVVDSEIIQPIVSNPQTDTIVTTTERNVLIKESSDQVVSETLVYNTVVAGQPGPPGPPGIVEEEMVYAKQVDFVTDNLIYRGEATVGSLSSNPVWRIRKIEIAIDGDVSETWANGSAAFINIWDDRASLTYS